MGTRMGNSEFMFLKTRPWVLRGQSLTIWEEFSEVLFSSGVWIKVDFGTVELPVQFYRFEFFDPEVVLPPPA